MRPERRVQEGRRALCGDLLLDRVLSAGQVRRRYGIELLAFTEAELRALGLYVFAVEGSAVFKGPVRLFNFVARAPLDQRESASQIIHQVGTAEMRWHLGAPQAWQAQGGALAASDHPDALYHREDGVCAAEYDTGSYGSALVADKLSRFNAFAHVYWGCASPVRVRRLSERYQGRPRLTFFHAAWWL